MMLSFRSGQLYRGNVTIEMPLKSWDLLEETVKLDAQSGAVDYNLRRDIEEAFRKLTFRPHDGRMSVSGPSQAVYLIMETLEMDSESIRFDTDLRRDIAMALKTVHYMAPTVRELRSKIRRNPYDPERTTYDPERTRSRLIKTRMLLEKMDRLLDEIDYVDPYGDIVENFCEEDKTTRHTTRIIRMIDDDLAGPRTARH